MTTTLRRREALLAAGAATLAAGFGSAFWRSATATAASAQTGAGPYGPLLAPDANGVRLPKGFRSRVVARSLQPVPGTGYVLPLFPDGSATFPTPDGGWIQVVNSEVPLIGGASAIRYAKDGRIVDAYGILTGTSTNCAGGPTPWGTWLSCEEVDEGRVWECDPTGRTQPVVRPAMGVFKHEAACVDPVHEHVYLTEDRGDGCLYRFVPDHYPDLSQGRLEVATVTGTGGEGSVSWTPLPDPAARGRATRDQVAGATRFERAEGIWFDAGTVYVATTGDETIHALDTTTQRISILYRRADAPGSPLQGVDNVTVSRSGDVYVCEDSYDNDPDAMDVCLITPEGEVARFCKLTGREHFLPSELESEITGVAFSPDGSRMYFGSQRAGGVGAVYEISGPFRTARPTGGGPAPVDPALLGLTAASAISSTALLQDGLRVRLTAAGPVAVTAVLKARVRRNGRLRTVTVARQDRQLAAGATSLRLRPRNGTTRAAVRAVRGATAATLEVAVRQADGSRAVRRRSVRIRGRRR